MTLNNPIRQHQDNFQIIRITPHDILNNRIEMTPILAGQILPVLEMTLDEILKESDLMIGDMAVDVEDGAAKKSDKIFVEKETENFRAKEGCKQLLVIMLFLLIIVIFTAAAIQELLKQST